MYLYETQVASPKAADALVRSKNKVLKPKVAIAKVSEVQFVEPIEQSRVFELSRVKQANDKTIKENLIKNRAIEKSISSTINNSIKLEIQKAVVSEMEKKR